VRSTDCRESDTAAGEGRETQVNDVERGGRRLWKFVVALAAIVALGAWSTPAAFALPNPSTTDNALSSVSAVSATDAWAVGSYAIDDHGDRNTLIVHWDGAKWTRFASPNPLPGHLNELSGVYARSSTDVWAVGDDLDSTSSTPMATLILHWNGAHWKQIASPSPGLAGNQLKAVSADASDDGWAVGTSSDGGVAHTLILRWHNGSWSSVTSPSPGTPSNILMGVTAVSTTKAWAVGNYYNGSTNAYDTLIEKWNGTSWSQSTSPNPNPAGENRLNAVSASSATDIWAVGTLCATVSGTCAFKDESTLIVHWNGTHWTRVKSPNPSTVANFLNGVSVDPSSSTDVWAVGWFNNVKGKDEPLTLHWTGAGWTKVATPSPSANTNFLEAVATVSATDALSVGVYANNTTSAFDTFALEWGGSSWTRT
jgi:hypothetical protein